MPRARISRLALEGDLPANKVARISRLTLDGTAVAGTTKRARISQLGLVGLYATKRARISQLQFVGSEVITLAPSLIATPDRVEPGATVTLSAAGTVGSAVSTAWSVTSGGAGVTLTGTGPTRTLVAPRDASGRSIVVRVDYTDSYGTTAMRTVTVTVFPQQLWFCRSDGTLAPVTRGFLRI